MHAARFLEQRGAKLVAASDSRGAVFNADGLSVESLIAHKRKARPLSEFSQGMSISGDDLIGLDCDIWIPAARPDVLNEKNVNRLKARLVLQGANIPATPEAEEWMHEHGILNIPDFIANAGGVICASVEYHGGTQSQAMAAIEDRIRSNTSEVLERAKEANSRPRDAAVRMARARVEEAMRYRKY
jgi:glutamate dehydrogenase (NAD(P)+)